LIFFLARRQERARLLVVGEYRPQEAASSEHLLKKVTQELKEHGQCEELRLKELTEDDIADYLAARFPREQVPMGLAKIIYRYTGGHPMFLELTVDELERREWIADPSVQRKLRAKLEELAATVPSGVREVIEGQFDRLSGEEKRLVEVASVAGEQFSASAVAAALEKKASDVEDICEGLACREQFLRRKEDEEWLDGTLATCYKFRHSWYWEVVYKRVTTAKRLELHRRIGEGLEKAFGKQARKKGGELAKHFERGRDYERAVQYLMQEAGTDLQRWGYSAKRVERLYLRASKLCRKVENPHRLFEVNKLGWTVYHTKAKLNEAFDLANRLVSLANQLKDEDPSTLVIAHEALGETFFRRGEFTDALGEFRYGVDFFDYLRPSSAAWVKPGVACQSYTGWVLWFLGYPEQALGKITDALSRARELSERDPYTLVSTLDFAARLRQFRREEQAVRELAEEAIKLSKDRFGLRMAQATILHGWALAQQGKVKEGIEETCEGLAECRGTGTEILRPYYLALLVEVYRKAGQAKKGLSTLVKALDAVKRSGERNYEAELYRLKGELLLKQKVKAKRQKTESEAEACFRKAIDIARSQGAKSLELRAVMSLGRLWQRQGKNEEAREMLAAIYRQFTEGFDTTDLKKAKALLETL